MRGEKPSIIDYLNAYDLYACKSPNPSHSRQKRPLIRRDLEVHPKKHNPRDTPQQLLKVRIEHFRLQIPRSNYFNPRKPSLSPSESEPAYQSSRL